MPSQVRPRSSKCPLERFRDPGVIVEIDRRAATRSPWTTSAGPGSPFALANIVLLPTGRGCRFHFAEYHDHPYFSEELAVWLLMRGIGMLGIDCITVDDPTARRASGFDHPVHRALLRAAITIIENLRTRDRT